MSRCGSLQSVHLEKPSLHPLRPFNSKKDVLYLIQLMENLNRPPVNISHPHGPSRARASSSSPQIPSLHSHSAWLQGCSTLWAMSILKPRGQGAVPALQQHPIPCGIHLACRGSCILHIRASPLLPSSPTLEVCSHHWDRRTSSGCWSRGRGQHVGTREGQIRFVSLLKLGKDYGLFKPVSTAFQLPVR